MTRLLLLLLLLLLTGSVLAACPLSVSFRPATGTIHSLQCKQQEGAFNFVPQDDQIWGNRTLPGLLALGDLSVRLRPARVQTKTVPAVPGLEPYPFFTQMSSGFGDPGAHWVLRLSCVQDEAWGCIVRRAGAGIRHLPLQPGELAAHDITGQLGGTGTPYHVERCAISLLLHQHQQQQQLLRWTLVQVCRAGGMP